MSEFDYNKWASITISHETWDHNYRAPGEKTPVDSWKRNAKACASVEKEEVREQVEKDFYWLLSDFKGNPGGRINANIGVEGRDATTLLNCFVEGPNPKYRINPADSLAGIFEQLHKQSQTLKSEGGYGTNFSYIRPSGTYVEGIGGRTPGVLKFMELWDKSSETITMGSEKSLGGKKKGEKKKIRKGAMMGILNVSHPEIFDYIDAKLTPGRFTKFNLSVGVTNGFMEAVINDADWDLRFPDTKFERYDAEWEGDLDQWESKGYPVVIYETIKARDLWEKVMKATYTRNDPGVIFLDLCNKLSPISYGEIITATNPCAESVMSAPGVCLLFSLNLTKFITKNQITNKFEFDFETFRKAISVAIRFADNINDITRAPLPEYKDTLIEKRRLGVGILGLGSLLYMLGIKYGSKESSELVDNISRIKCEEELLASAKLGKEKGSFPLFDREKFFTSHYWKTLPISPEVKKQVEEIGEMRNSHRSANAPTGNMSITVGCVSGGIEPVFLKEYIRWITVIDSERGALKEQGFTFPNPLTGEWFETEHLKLSKVGKDEILLGEFNGSRYQVDKSRGLTKAEVVMDYGWRFVKENYTAEEIAKMESAGVFVTTEQLTVNEHVDILKLVSKYVDQSSSKTVNLPNDYPYEDFKNLYMDAWKSGIKGITTYRAGTMTAVLQSIDSAKDTKEEVIDYKAVEVSRDRPKKLQSETHKVKLEAGDEVKNAYVTVSFSEGNPYEVFINTPVGDNLKDMQILELTSRLSSLAMRYGVPVDEITDQLRKVDGQFIYSIPNTLSKVLNEYVKTDSDGINHMVCPSCGEKTYIKKDGCTLCLSCSYSACG